MNDLIVALNGNATIIEQREKALALCAALEAPTDRGTAEACVQARDYLCTAIANVEAYRKRLTDPLNAAVKAAIAREREMCHELEEAIEFIDSALGDYRAQVQREEAARVAAAKAESDRIAAEEKAAGLEERLTPALVLHTPTAEVAKLPTRKVPRLIISDVSKIDMKFFDLNESKLTKFLANGGTSEGATVVYDEVLVKSRGGAK